VASLGGLRGVALMVRGETLPRRDNRQSREGLVLGPLCEFRAEYTSLHYGLVNAIERVSPNDDNGSQPKTAITYLGKSPRLQLADNRRRSRR
jgi:hypothetical protein